MAPKSKKSKKAEEAAKKAQKAADKAAQKPPGKRTWKLMDRAATVVGAMLATRATNVAWRGLSGKQPPKSGRHPEVKTREAVLWAMIGGGLTELIKTGIRRGTANYWVKSTGELPPGMKTLAPLQNENQSAEEPEAVSRKRRGKKK